MTYYPDLTRYVYDSRFFEDPDWTNSFNIGWLEKGKPFRTGTAPPSFLDGLRRFCEVSFRQTRGLHPCDFCSGNGRKAFDSGDGIKLLLASAEIRVLGEGGKIYCAPNLVFHYVKAHNYLPPDEFVKAVMNGPFPDEAEYIAFFMRRDIPFDSTLIFRE